MKAARLAAIPPSFQALALVSSLPWRNRVRKAENSLITVTLPARRRSICAAMQNTNGGRSARRSRGCRTGGTGSAPLDGGLRARLQGRSRHPSQGSQVGGDAPRPAATLAGPDRQAGHERQALAVVAGEREIGALRARGGDRHGADVAIGMDAQGALQPLDGAPCASMPMAT